MKIILSSMLALAIAGSPVLTQEPDEKEKPKQQEPKKQPEPKAKPAQEPDEKPKPKPKQEPAPPSKQQKPDEKPQQQDDKERQKQQKEQAKREKNRPPQEQSAPQNNRNQQASKGQRIPPEQFRANFGREHHFRVARSGGDNRRFEYHGYWFEVVELWPAGWSFDDDCYIEEEGDEYYLVDVVHPETRILVIVVSA